MKKAIFLVALVALPACQPAQSPSGSASDTCGATRYAHLRGAPESSVMALSFNQPVRIIAPRDSVTADEVPTRLNFLLDAGGMITDITCG